MNLYNNELYMKDVHYLANLDLSWEKLSDKAVVISGGTGALGSVLADALFMRNELFGNDIEIFILGRKKEKAEKRFGDHLKNHRFHFIQWDINEPFPEAEFPSQFMIHAASNTHPMLYSQDPIGTIHTNVKGTENLLNYGIRHDLERFLFMSSVEIYGENRSAKESFSEMDCGYIDCNKVRAGYPESKRLGEALCQAYRDVHKIEVVIPRLCRAYGPTLLESDSKALSQFIHNAVKHEDIVLKSEGKQFYSYIHFTDAASAVLRILLTGADGEAYNISDPDSDIQLCDLAQILAELAGTEVVFQLPEQAEAKGYSLSMKAILDSGKLKALGWRPKYDIESGLEKTLDILRY